MALRELEREEKSNIQIKRLSERERKKIIKAIYRSRDWVMSE